MLTIEIDETAGIALLEPSGALSEDDFKRAANAIDNYIERHEKLAGLIIHTKDFPGWDSFGAFSSHLKFVKDHHKELSRVAIVTDSIIGNLGETIASHFINAELKHFEFAELEKARDWVSPG